MLQMLLQHVASLKFSADCLHRERFGWDQREARLMRARASHFCRCCSRAAVGDRCNSSAPTIRSERGKDSFASHGRRRVREAPALS
jgi:hypothetical protein